MAEASQKGKRDVEIGTVEFTTLNDRRGLLIRYRIGQKFYSKFEPLSLRVLKMAKRPFSDIFRPGEVIVNGEAVKGVSYKKLAELDFGLIGLNVEKSGMYLVQYEYNGEIKEGYLMRLANLDTCGDFDSPHISDEGRAIAMEQMTGIRPFTQEEFTLFNYLAYEQADKLKNYFNNLLGVQKKETAQSEKTTEEKKSDLELILGRVRPVEKIAERELIGVA